MNLTKKTPFVRFLKKLSLLCAHSGVALSTKSAPLAGTQRTVRTAENLRQEVLNEYKLCQYLDPRIPEHITRETEADLMQFQNRRKRIRWLLRLGSRQMEKQQRKVLQPQRREQLDKIHELMTVDNQLIREAKMRPTYALWNNSMIIRVRTSTMNAAAEARVRHVWSLNAPTVCLDNPLVSSMNPFALSQFTRQLVSAYTANRDHRSPCRLYCAGLELDSPQWEKIYGRLPFRASDHHGLGAEFCSPSFVDLFPDRSKLVYVVQEAKIPLQRVDEDLVYVLPTMPLKRQTMSRAKELNVRCRSLPLDKYVRWFRGTKQLNTPITLKILLDVYEHGDWARAIRNHAPPYRITEGMEFDPERAVAKKRLLQEVEWLLHQTSNDT